MTSEPPIAPASAASGSGGCGACRAAADVIAPVVLDLGWLAEWAVAMAGMPTAQQACWIFVFTPALVLGSSIHNFAKHANSAGSGSQPMTV